MSVQRLQGRAARGLTMMSELEGEGEPSQAISARGME